MKNISVVLIEDHDLSRISLCAALKQYEDIKMLGSARDGNSGLKRIKDSQPDVALVDIGLPDIDGIEVTHQLREHREETSSFDTKILMLTMYDNKKSVLAAFAAGADSYTLKSASTATLVQAIRNTHDGDAWIDPAIAKIVLEQNKKIKKNPNQDTPDSGLNLTARELEILELIVDGCSNSAISSRLYITVGTVKSHVCRLLNKLSANDRTQAAVYALRTGLVD